MLESISSRGHALHLADAAKDVIAEHVDGLKCKGGL